MIDLIDRKVATGYFLGFRDLADLALARLNAGSEERPEAAARQPPPSINRQISDYKPQRHILDVLRTSTEPLYISEISAALRRRGIDRTPDEIRTVLRRVVDRGWVTKKGSSYFLAPDVSEDAWAEEVA